MPDENLPFRIAFLAEYDGTDFVGFQRQNNGRSVQGVLEEALAALYKRPISVCGCSRTDSGVHAKGHVSHADVPFMIPEDKIPYAMNALLPEDISIYESALVPDFFHARFDSIGKKYIYRIWNAPFRPAADRRFVVHVPGHLDIIRMQEAAKILEGEHDFSAFCCESGQHANPVRRMDDILVRTFDGSPLIEIEVRGKSFLYNMVRIIAGTLIYAGQGKLDPAEITAILSGKDRRTAGKTMPARGLTLEKVYYEPDLFAGLRMADE
jgi:tRNA pseudouridine38-40 synthase